MTSRVRTFRRLPFLTGAALGMAALLMAADGGIHVGHSEQTADARVTTAADLIAEHDCWTGDAPADVEIPGHVVVTIDGEARYAGERMVGKALEQIFDGTDHGLTIHAFCR